MSPFLITRGTNVAVGFMPSRRHRGKRVTLTSLGITREVEDTSPFDPLAILTDLPLLESLQPPVDMLKLRSDGAQ